MEKIEKPKKDFNEIYKTLNKEQKLAVDTIYGPVLVLAGPGTGKTHLLSVRVGHILKEINGVPPSSILCLTYTEAAAEEMKKRIIELTGQDGYKVKVFTFHAFANYVFEKYKRYFFDQIGFENLEQLESIKILENILDKYPGDFVFSKKLKGKYLYLRDILSCISDIKTNGFIKNEFYLKLKDLEKEWKEINKIFKKYNSLFSERLSMKLIIEFEKLNFDLKKIKSESAKIISNNLEIAINLTKNSINEESKRGSTEALKNWKEKFLIRDKKDNECIFYLSDQEKLEKLYPLAEIYEEYENKLKEKGLRDYDDMILSLIEKLSKEKSLRQDLAEEFQFILVDEFQDTNLAQFKILEYLTNEEIHGSPNILCVGDDDQAIYKFQGAESTNVDKFLSMYKDVKEIILKENRRSTQKILDFARKIIIKANDRLENKNEKRSKILESKIEEIEGKKINTEILLYKFNDDISEYSFVVNKIDSLIKNENVNANEIAIIAKKHSYLDEIKDFLISKNINFYHKQKENIFGIEVINNIISLFKFIGSAFEKKSLREEFLPEILFSEFFEINAEDILNIAISAKKREDQSWLAEMKESKNEKIREIFYFLMETIKLAKHRDLREIFDILIGNKSIKLKLNIEDKNKVKEIEYFSPFKKYYFDNLNNRNYFLFLEAIRKLIDELNIYFKNTKKPKAIDLEEFLNAFIENEIEINIEKPSLKSDEGINLLTAHGAKGLEFKYVFLIASDDNSWKKSKQNKISFPETYPMKNKNEDDDIIKLLYVAITRAKTHIYISYHKKEKIEFLNDIIDEEEILENFENIKKVKRDILEEMNIDTNKQIKEMVNNYKLSVSGLNNFLNIFKFGPSGFFKNNILKFPTAEFDVSINYGNAIHKTLEEAYLYYKFKNKIINEKELIKIFEKNNFDLDNADERRNYEKGLKALKRFYKYIKEDIKKDFEIEYDFKNSGIVIGKNTELTGKIDKIIIDGENVFVYDYKTGGTLESFENNKNNYENIKAYEYKRQLAFYKILLNKDNKFKNKNIKLFLQFLDEEKEEKMFLEGIIDDEFVKRIENLSIIISSLIKDLNYKVDEDFIKKENINIDKKEADVKYIILFEDYLLEKYKYYLK